MSTKICQALFKALVVCSNRRQCQGSLGAYNSHVGDVQLKANKYLVLKPEVMSTMGFPSGSFAEQEMQVQSLGQEDPLEEKLAAHCSILVWEIPRTEDPVGYSPWSCRVGHDLVTEQQQ